MVASEITSTIHITYVELVVQRWGPYTKTSKLINKNEC